MREEIAQLQQVVHSHAIIDQAIGVLFAVVRLTPDQGWNVLRARSQNTNIKLRHVAELLVDWARTGNLTEDIRTELERQLALHSPPTPLHDLTYRRRNRAAILAGGEDDAKRAGSWPPSWKSPGTVRVCPPPCSCCQEGGPMRHRECLSQAAIASCRPRATEC
ncbi:ANTAR domain-containing protein [Streptomyces sp. NPDC048512]|uniref:ANTAR domain-containing protein n=1 Tax=unclassified Streptomyces TaxID=2593676 RepID=UPI00321C2186